MGKTCKCKKRRVLEPYRRTRKYTENCIEEHTGGEGHGWEYHLQIVVSETREETSEGGKCLPSSSQVLWSSTTWTRLGSTCEAIATIVGAVFGNSSKRRNWWHCTWLHRHLHVEKCGFEPLQVIGTWNCGASKPNKPVAGSWQDAQGEGTNMHKWNVWSNEGLCNSYHNAKQVRAIHPRHTTRQERQHDGNVDAETKR